ncbi:MAG: hypothetical protein JSU88_09305 [Nitrospinaceae bacterium]|nr:MAG: hypothetical protein JSU88_09305 [Nitrospinaceae bacterium]
MNPPIILPPRLFDEDRRINLCHLHDTFQGLAGLASKRLKESCGIDIPITAGMWGGSYLIAGSDGRARTNVVRLYSIVNLPQNTALDEKELFEQLMEIYHQNFRTAFGKFGLDLVDPRWGEPVPYSNRLRPTTTLQMWDASRRVKFVRAFFVWNTATWEESIIYDAIRNVRQLKENLDINHRPAKKASDELKFLLQDVLIIYFTLRPALTPDFAEHAEPIVQDLLARFLRGLHDPEEIEEQYHRVFANALVYGYEEALEGPYRRDGLNIFKVEDWPVEKINWVPGELKKTLAPYLRETFSRFRLNLEKEKKPPPA